MSEYTDTDEELAMANARIKDLEAGLEHEGCDRVLHATETALAAAQHQVEVEQMSVERWRGWHQENGRIAAEAIKRAERAEEEAVNAHRAWLRVSDELDDLRDSIADPFTQGAVVRAELAERRNLLNPQSTEYVEELEHRAERAEQFVNRIQRMAGATRDGFVSRADLWDALAALDTTAGLAEKLGASHVEQHDTHAAAVRAGKARVDGLTTDGPGADEPQCVCGLPRHHQGGCRVLGFN